MNTITINSHGDLIVDKFDMIMSLLGMGFTIGVVLFVLAASIRIGWKFAPWAIGIALVAWLFF